MLIWLTKCRDTRPHHRMVGHVYHNRDTRAVSRLWAGRRNSWQVTTHLWKAQITADSFQGSLAAAFQGWAYGAFTPAGGIFATLTSLGMVGFLAPPVALFGACVATAATFGAWMCQ